jgi:hypothetical protein
MILQSVDLWGIKRGRILRRIQKYKLSLVKIAPKLLFEKKDETITFCCFFGENT